MIKMVTLLKRRPGMSMEEFIEYYESHHRVIGERVLKPHAARYVRRYLDPVANPSGGKAEDSEYDVLLEVWYPDEASFEAAMKTISAPDNLKIIEEDEARLFDRPRMRSFMVREFESDMKA